MRVEIHCLESRGQGRKALYLQAGKKSIALLERAFEFNEGGYLAAAVPVEQKIAAQMGQISVMKCH